MKLDYINKIGVEIEGGWAESPAIEVKHDGSVKFPGVRGVNYVGEIVSTPYKNIESLRKWVVENYPSFINNTCGLHVHYSFNNRFHYSALMEETFKEFFLVEMNSWGKSNNVEESEFWDRLNGKNIYCTHKNWNPEKQASLLRKYEDNIRRCTWNFCYSLHGTAECRVLPTFQQKETAWNAIIKLTEIVETWIHQYKDNISEHREEIEEIEEDFLVIGDYKPSVKTLDEMVVENF